MANPDYSNFDADILTEIGNGNRTFGALVGCLEEKARAFCAEKDKDAWRVIDRRLQALRKKGKVGYDTKLGWRRRNTAGDYID